MENGTNDCVVHFSQCGVSKSQNCDLVWYILNQGSVHNPTLHFRHLILVLVCLFCTEHT